jgi:hypothetical protein
MISSGLRIQFYGDPLWDEESNVECGVQNAEWGMRNENRRLKQRVWPQTHADGYRLLCPVDLTGQKPHSLLQENLLCTCPKGMTTVVATGRRHNSLCGSAAKEIM